MRSRVDRKFTVTVNESFPRDEVLLNLDQIGDDVKPGSLMAMNVLRPESDKQSHGGQHKQHIPKDASPGAASRPAEAEHRYIFVVKDMPKEIKTRYPTVEVYVAKHIADAFGMRKGSQVTLTPVSLSAPPSLLLSILY